VIGGNLNAHSPLWGHPNKNRFGVVVEKILMDQDVILRNGDDFTYIDARTGNTSTLDLTLISSNLDSDH
jgi:hypothetical protein